MQCHFVPIDESTVKCVNCGHVAFTRSCASKTFRVCDSRGLGDMVADGLAAVGITKERVSKAIGRPCGCGKRQEKLNEFGRKFGIG